MKTKRIIDRLYYSQSFVFGTKFKNAKRRYPIRGFKWSVAFYYFTVFQKSSLRPSSSKQRIMYRELPQGWFMKYDQARLILMHLTISFIPLSKIWVICVNIYSFTNKICSVSFKPRRIRCVSYNLVSRYLYRVSTTVEVFGNENKIIKIYNFTT